MSNNGNFLWADIPENFPDISMPHLTQAQLENLQHISLVDAIKEGRRRVHTSSPPPPAKTLTTLPQITDKH